MSTLPNKQDVIVTNDLTLGYNRHSIVSNISLNIAQGEFIGIFGPNGSGKSTFLRALLGLIKPLSGTIFVFGSKPKSGCEKIGYMPQIRNHASVANLTSRSLMELSFQGVRYGLPIISKQNKAEIQRILELVEAQSYVDRPFRQLSGGERQRIYLAQALLGKPRILLLDEPLSSLDPHYQDTFISLLCDIQQKLKVTILFTAHDPNPLLKVMNRVLYFAYGKGMIGSTDEVITSPKLSYLYGTPIEVVHYKGRLIVLGEDQNLSGSRTHHD